MIIPPPPALSVKFLSLKFAFLQFTYKTRIAISFMIKMMLTPIDLKSFISNMKVKKDPRRGNVYLPF